MLLTPLPSKVEKLLMLSKVFFFICAGLSLILTPIILNHQGNLAQNLINKQATDLRIDTIKLVNTRADKIQTQITEVVGVLDKRINSLQTNTFSQIKTTNDNLFTRVDTLETDLNTQVTDTRKDVITSVNTTTGGLLSQTSDLDRAITNLSNSFSSVPSILGARLEVQTNCSTNSLCWQNMLTDTLVNARYTGKDISTAAKAFSVGFPNIIKNADLITANVGSITGNIKQLTKIHWYDRVLSYAGNGALIYSRINPITNLTITGLTAVSSQSK